MYRRESQPAKDESPFTWHKHKRDQQQHSPLSWWQWPIALWQRYIRRPSLCVRCVDFAPNRGFPNDFCISPVHLRDARCMTKLCGIWANHIAAVLDDDLRLRKKMWQVMKDKLGGDDADFWKT